MRTTNLFWPVFKSIEKEIITLSNDIHFDDDQLYIYSVKIAEILLRCVVEIEAIAKELYFKNGGAQPEKDKDLYFDTDCLDLLETKWQLSKKQVIISSANFYFQKDENTLLYPLKKANRRGTSGADWAKAYQAVKHNRTKKLYMANLKHLLRAAAALYVLNLYYRNDVFELGEINANNFTHTFSDIFDVKVHKSTGESFGAFQSYRKGENFDECIYLIKYTDYVHTKHFEYGKNFLKAANLILQNNPSMIDNRNNSDKITLNKEYTNMFLNAHRFITKDMKFDITEDLRYEAVLNKNQEIYKQKDNQDDTRK